MNYEPKSPVRTLFGVSVCFIYTWDCHAKIYRIVRFVKNSPPHTGRKLTISFCPRLFEFKREFAGWILIFHGVRIHYKVSHGGFYAQ